MSIFIGIDVSTTSTKAIFVEETGRVLAISSTSYDFETPYPLWSEQDPDLWWQATKNSINEGLKKNGIDASQVKGIGLTGQMHGLVILDKNGRVLRPSILWNDQRTQKQCNDIRRIIGKDKFIEITGNDALTGFTAPKILWVKEQEPSIYEKINQILLPKDFVRYKLTGEFAMDRSDGAGTILFDLKKRNWSKEIINQLELNPDWFPPTFEGTQTTGMLTAEAADAIGLIPGIPIFAGGGDQAAAAVGTGAVEEGILSISLGTSGVIFATTNTPIYEKDGLIHSFCHAVPEKWHLMGVLLSASGSLRWFHDGFCASDTYDKLVDSAKNVVPGSNGLLFLPYLTGERTPHPDPLARGGFIGLTVQHSMSHCIRAILEGVAFGLRDIYELMLQAGLKNISQIRVTGGGAKSDLWLQIIADCLNVEIATVNSEEGAAFGAALLALTGSGIFNSVEEACNITIKLNKKVYPGKTKEIYDQYYQEYCMLYPSLKNTFHRLSEIG